MRRLLLLTVLGLALAAPASAMAVTTCEYEPSILTVKFTSGGVGLELSGEEIQVSAGGAPLSCSGGTPTLSNTGTVAIADESVAFNLISIANPQAFAATTEIVMSLEGPFTDTLQLTGTNGPDHWIFGETGINTNATGQADIRYMGEPPGSIVVAAKEGTNTMSARGEFETGKVVKNSFFNFSGGSGVDTFEGGEMGDILSIGSGPDVARGFGSNDRIQQHGEGDDVIDGGEGEDTVAFPFSTGITVDLNKTTQETGEGNDTLTGIENISGGEGNDTLIGDEGPNRIEGGFGDDELDGRGGDDELDGSFGNDLVTFEKAPAGEIADLEPGEATGGFGEDTLQSIENLIGSPFADKLTGDTEPNTIRGLGGTDAIKSEGGADLVEVRDGEADDASCGPGTDRAISDQLTLDTIHSDCENVEALPEPPAPPKPPAPPPPAAPRLKLRLGGAHGQRLLKQKAVIVTAACLNVACKATASAGGKAPKLRLKPLTRRIAAGDRAKLKLKLSRKQLAAIASALAAGKKPKLTVSVAATGSNGEVVHRKLVVTAKP